MTRNQKYAGRTSTIHILQDLVNHGVYVRIKVRFNENHPPDHLHQCVMRKLETRAVGDDGLHLSTTFRSNHKIKSSKNYICCQYRSCCINYSKSVSDKHSLISHEYLTGICYQCKNRVLWTDCKPCNIKPWEKFHVDIYCG